MKCCLCGRPLFTALIFIAGQPVGPVCARRHGLVEPARKGRGALQVNPTTTYRLRRAAKDCETLDLFAEEVANG